MGRYGNVVTGPKKTPANTVRNSTFSTSNRFGGPPSVSGRMGPQSGPPGSGRPSQISRPAMAAAATARRRPPNYGPPGTVTPGGPPGTGATAPAPAPAPVTQFPNYGPPGTVTPGGPPGTGAPSQTIPAPQTHFPNYGPPGTVTPGGPPGTGAPAPAPAPATAFPNYGPPGTVSPGGPPGTGRPQAIGAVPSRTGRRKPVENAGTFGVTPGGPPGTGSPSQISRPAPSQPRNVGPNVNQLAPVTPGGPPGSGRPTQISRPATVTPGGPPGTGSPTQISRPAVPQPQGPGPSANMLVEGSQGAQEVTRNQGYTDQQVHDWLGTEGAQNLLAKNAANAAAVATPAWDPAMNDPAITGPVGMWTEVGNGAQMPDPADADSWQAMQDAVNREFGPGQNIYNPEYDTERFSTYDPSNTVAPFAPSGWGGGYGATGGGGGGGMGTYDPFTGEYLQFGEDLAGIESQRGMIDEADAFWDLAQQRKWDETNRGIPGIFNSRGMIDSGLLPRAKAFSAADQDYEWKVQQWQMGNQKAALDAQQAAAEQGLTGARSTGVFDPWTSSYR